MSKPSYAAVAASPAKDTGSHGQVQQQGEAPPPYTGPSSQQQAPPPPQQSHQPGQHIVGYHGHYHPGHLEHQHSHTGPQWTPPASLEVARSRALRRFWIAFIWAWVIWILIGLMIGGGVSDVRHEPMGRHGHWGKHGRWHDDGSVDYPIAERLD